MCIPAYRWLSAYLLRISAYLMCICLRRGCTDTAPCICPACCCAIGKWFETCVSVCIRSGYTDTHRWIQSHVSPQIQPDTQRYSQIQEKPELNILRTQQHPTAAASHARRQTLPPSPKLWQGWQGQWRQPDEASGGGAVGQGEG